MTTKRNYECNLCRLSIQPTGRIGRGVKFGSNGIEWTSPLNAENHLCDDCVNSLMAAFRSLAAVSTPPQDTHHD
jgi:hypothetical protein